MKKTIAWILILVLALTLAGCGGQEKLVGTWEGQVNLADSFNASLNSAEDLQYLSVDTLNITLVLTFTEEGTYTMAADAASVTAAMEGLKEELSAGMEQYLTDVISQAGMEMNIDDILALMGTTMEELMGQLVTREMLDEMTAGLVSEGNFDAEDGKLYLSGSLDAAVDESVYHNYTLEGNILTLVSPSQSDGSVSGLYPIVFSKTA